MPIVLGTAAGLGAWLLARGLRPRQPSLAVALRDLNRPRWATTVRSPAPRSWADRWAPWAVSFVRSVGPEPSTIANDLAVVGRTAERQALDKLTMAVLGLGLPVGFSVVVRLGGVTVAPAAAGGVALAGALLGFVYPDLALRSEAAARRREFRHALGAFLDLVTIILAGGGGVESALDGAARTGDGWAFARIRSALAVSRLNRESPWTVLGRLADELQVPELGELASSVGLAGESGAKVRASLAAKAASLRDHELAEAEASAEAASERMAFPVVTMLTGFILLVGYPAVANVYAF